jgi:Ca2+-binding EF-hand superfamily protein
MKTFPILAGTVLLASAGAVLAQPAAGPRADRNAPVTRQQVIERTDERFARLDLNSDGRATREEARQAAQQRREQAIGRQFERLDANRDGSISRAEFDQARSQRREQRAERGEQGPRAGMRGMRHRGAGGEGMRGMRHRGPGGAGMRGERLFGEQGFVTREQMRERALARFDRIDANRDGTLTAAERQQAREQMREQFRQRRQERRGQEG